MNDAPHKTDNDFRDHLATADQTGRRVWVFPAKPKGRLYTARSIVSVFLLAFLFGAPFIRVGGQPILLFNIIERRFIIFGVTFWPQDFFLLVLGAITLVIFIILFTAVFGRLFCGWICPQTIFLEMVFRRIEYWIEGGPSRQKQLAARPWDESKVFKRTLKHTLFFAISFLIGNTFLAYIIGTDNLFRIVTDNPLNHLGGLTAMIVFSFLFYGVFAWFREQACTLVCPYGRLQGVLIDSNSIVVAYDYQRGEPRAPMRRGKGERTEGDCVECNACVAVCPTGIDIRNGTQLECVNCTACIDACNRTMQKVNLPQGLIRYSSQAQIEGKPKKWITGRVGIYSVVLAILVTLLTVLLVTRTDVETTILRPPGSLYTEIDHDLVRNLYTAKLVNKTSHEVPVSFRLKSPKGGTLTLVGAAITVPPRGISESAFFVDLPQSMLFSASTLIEVEVLDNGKVAKTVRTNFLGPQPGSKHHDEGDKSDAHDRDDH